MNTVYILFNYDTDKCMYASRDKQLLEEIMCDFFMDELYYAFCWDVSYTKDHPVDIAHTIWENTVYYFENYINIFECQCI